MRLQLQRFLQFIPVIGNRELEGKAAKVSVGFGDDQCDIPAGARATEGCCYGDESRFCHTRGDGRIRIYRQRNGLYTEACTLARYRFGGGGSVMVWGSVSQHHRTELVVIAGNLNSVRYREDIILPYVVPFLQARPDMTLQHDNATSHTARSV